MHQLYEDIGFAKIDHHRIIRKGFPEVIFCQGKTNRQISKIACHISKMGHNVLATRANQTAFKAIKKYLPNAVYHKTAGIITVKRNKEIKTKKRFMPTILVITAGTSDIPVAEEAIATAEFLGNKVEKLFDIGISGIHRLFKNLDMIRKASVIIVVAGMEGALPSIIGGLIDKPIISVPTSVGYGSNFKGLSALLTMLNSCSPGISVVNIDNGFGAAVFANSILKLLDKNKLDTKQDEILLIETNIDDMNPKLYDGTIKSLLDTGALDAFYEPIRMKKSRLGIKLTVLCAKSLKDKILEVIFKATTSFGVRISKVQREKLKRHFKTVKTRFGKAKIKIGTLNNNAIIASPEYEDYKKLAKKHHVPITKIHSEILKEWATLR